MQQKMVSIVLNFVLGTEHIVKNLFRFIIESRVLFLSCDCVSKLYDTLLFSPGRDPTVISVI